MNPARMPPHWMGDDRTMGYIDVRKDHGFSRNEHRSSRHNEHSSPGRRAHGGRHSSSGESFTQCADASP
jgi:hypothetical protein